MKNHRILRDERRKSTWDSYPNSLDIIGQLVCTYAQQHECRILKCWMKQFAIKCLISQHQKQYWGPNSLHWLHQIDVATSNSLEQFQLVEIKFKLFAPILYWILGLKYRHVPKYQIVWTTSQASRDANSNSLEQFQLVDSKFKLFAPVLYCILGLKYVQTCWSKSHLLYWQHQTVGFPSIK